MRLKQTTEAAARAVAYADVPGEGERFRGAFEGDRADAGAVVDVFDGDEFGLWRTVGAVEANGGGVVWRAESGCIEFVAQGGGEHCVGFRVGVEEMANLAFDLFRLGEHGTADLEGVTLSEARRRLLVDLQDTHPQTDLRVGERAVHEPFGQRVVVEADKEARAAREVERTAVHTAAVKPTQRIEAEFVVLLVATEPLVESARQVVLIVERHRFYVG